MDTLDIAEVARLTGLTSRALRFYEARGLVQPLRTAAGRRHYGAGELARLNAVIALKRAGFSLAQIGQVLKDRRLDLAGLVRARLAALDAQAAELVATRARLTAVRSRLDRGEPIDVATLCSLLDGGGMDENWKAVTDRYLSPDARADFAATPMPDGFDQAAYTAQWRALGDRIEAALPLHPASAEAQGFAAEWQALLAPFAAVATPAMMDGVGRLYDRMDEWRGEQQPPFSPDAYALIKAAAAAARSAGN